MAKQMIWEIIGSDKDVSVTARNDLGSLLKSRLLSPRSQPNRVPHCPWWGSYIEEVIGFFCQYIALLTSTSQWTYQRMFSR